MQQEMNNKSDVEYKETELGLFPSDWDILTVDDLFYVKQGKQLSSRESKEGKIEKPFLRTSNLTWGKVNITNLSKMFFTPEEFEKLKLKAGDILVCEGGDIGRTALFNGELEECAYQNHLHRLRLKNQDDSRLFFVFWMNYAINQKKMYVNDANRTTIPNLSGSRLKRFIVPHPPFDEQNKISYVLSSIQNAKEKTENVINTLTELKKSMMKHLFTYGPVSLEEAKNVKLKETEIGWLPEGWDVIKVGEVFEFTKKPRDLTIDQKENVLFIPMKCISESDKQANWIVKKFSEVTSGTFVMKNDLIVGKITPCFENGKQALLVNLPTEFAFATTEVWALHSKNERVIHQHLYNYLKIPEIRKELSGKMEGSTGRQRLPRHVLENLLIPLPPFSEQQKIALMLSTVDKKIKSEGIKKSSIDELFKSLLHNLMTAKIRVNNLEI
jgi:type I restriction enzyme, S subunit